MPKNTMIFLCTLATTVLAMSWQVAAQGTGEGVSETPTSNQPEAMTSGEGSSLLLAFKETAERVKPLLKYSIEDLKLALSVKVRETYKGGKIVSDEVEPKFLGVIADKREQNSIFDKFGSHGSEYASESVWNKYSAYGNSFSTNSPFNPISTNPPLIIKDGEVIGRLTVNYTMREAVNPLWLRQFFQTD